MDYRRMDMDLEALKTAIREVLREELAVLAAPKSRAAADRQKRYRERQKTAVMAVAEAKKTSRAAKSVTRDVTIRNGDVTSDVWSSYSCAYAYRYGVPPVRNVKVNAQIKAFVQRVGAEEAAAIAAWYVGSNVGRRVQSKHSTGLLLMDAEGIRTEWAMGRDVTQHEAQQADKTQANGNVWGQLIAEARNAG